MSIADGLLLSGGDDVATELYGEVRTEKCGPVSELRDEFEISLIKKAVSKNIPILGICRGIQVMNVALGGTLYEDMPNHKQSTPNFMPSHKVDISGILESIYPKEANVNSFHHQAVKKTAQGLEICAISYDGYIEGIYKKNHPFFIGVQWHPEHMINNDVYAKRLFETFVNECATYRKVKQNDKGACT